jgi:ppGpp synthetase/RelA/SpoT-type nucleotidyltranferase
VSNKGIHHFSIEWRVKELDSFMGKMLRKKIDNPEEIKDLVGLRIKCFILSDVEREKKVIEEN